MPLPKGISLGLKRLTLVFVVSSGLIALDRSMGGVPALAADEAATTEREKIDERNRALELLRQAVTELQANRIDAARRLAKQASELNATYSLFDVRPELVLAEIDRKEQNKSDLPGAAVGGVQDAAKSRKATGGPVGAVADPTDPFESPKASTPVTARNGSAARTQTPPFAQAALEQQSQVRLSETPASGDQSKARAIEILERGLQALDEQRLDDAERDARTALSLNASFGKLEYKPEYLMTEVGIARARLRLDAATSPQPQSSPPPMSTSSMTPPQPAVVQAQFPQEASPTGRPSKQAWIATGSVAECSPQTPLPRPYSATQPAANASQATSARQRAERAVSEALSDLHAGRDEMARSRMESALNVIQAGAVAPTPGLFTAQIPVGNETSQFLPNLGAGIHVPLTEHFTGQASDTRGVVAVGVQPTPPTVQPDVVYAYPGELPFYSLDCLPCPCDTNCQPPKLCPCYFRGMWTGLHGE
jgi:hypothetical protein